MKIIFALFMSLFLLPSCIRAIHRSVSKGVYSDNNKYEIKSMTSGCCGCKAVYYTLYSGKRIDEQFIDEYICGFGEPTKYKFNYNSSGQFISITPWIAVFDSTFVIPVATKERQLLSSIDSILINVDSNHKPTYSSIRGFRPKRNDENIHPFAYDKRNKAIYPR